MLRNSFLQTFVFLFSSCLLVGGGIPHAFSPGQAGDQDDSVHLAKNAVRQFEVHPELDVELFAAEPFLANPSNIDIDHLGRVWVCEIVNYRHFRNKDAKPREAGDRILIIEDIDGDAVADKETVFYQGRDIDSAHGICVLGDRAIVSANDSVFFLIDTDGDLKADKKEVLFTGIGGVQHDHGIHAFVFGPDGKLYFNFGNSGNQILDKNGKQIIDLAGNPVIANRQPYNQGMIFRCNLDGSDFETLAWNFRNNWEMCVDSFGSIWQSDNDDDGNRATRINYVMPFGNYGYTDQRTGSNWKTPRSGMHEQIPDRHWHQNDPGVVPNLLITGAGSPTGICVYEGETLPTVFHNQMIHCDAGPSIVRAYPVKKRGAGYTAEMVPLIDGAKKNQWFRPSDVCVAPDGSLIVADWYDPGVGGHRMQDIERGRLFRISKKGQAGTYRFEKPDFTSPASAAIALRSPNHATRYLAWTALKNFGAQAVGALEEMSLESNPRLRARALWVLGNLDFPKPEKLKFIHAGLNDSDPDLRVMSIRLCVALRNELSIEDIQDQIDTHDPAPEVRRAILIGLRQWPVDNLPQIWASLADQYQSGDRWYLEALGIAAEGHWNECMKAWANDNPGKLKSPAGRDIVWRSRGSNAAAQLAALILDESTKPEETTRYFRAFDFLDSESKPELLAKLAFGDNGFDESKKLHVLMEAMSRLSLADLSAEQTENLNQLIEKFRGSMTFVKLVDKFSASDYYSDLLRLTVTAQDRQIAADAMGVLMDKKQLGQVHQFVVNADEQTREIICDALVNCGKRPASFVLAGIAKREDVDSELRTYAIRRLGQIQSGANDMLYWIDQKEAIDPILMPAIQAALHSATWPNIKRRANELFPIAASKDNRPLPAMGELASRTGNAKHGKTVFEGIGTCSKCHVVHGKGIEVGPDLSEIGTKLSKLALIESILFPSAGISHNYENWMVLKEDGQIISGVLVGETESEVQIKDDKGINHVIALDDIDNRKQQKLSLMPADLHKELTEQDLVDLVEYLTTLKK